MVTETDLRDWLDKQDEELDQELRGWDVTFVVDHVCKVHPRADELDPTWLYRVVDNWLLDRNN